VLPEQAVKVLLVAQVVQLLLVLVVGQAALVLMEGLVQEMAGQLFHLPSVDHP
jgi:hypothetical protein